MYGWLIHSCRSVIHHFPSITLFRLKKKKNSPLYDLKAKRRVIELAKLTNKFRSKYIHL